MKNFSDLTRNSKLLLIITVIISFLSVRLGIAAVEYGNWRGFIFSVIHLLVVGIGSFYALRKRPTIKSDAVAPGKTS